MPSKNTGSRPTVSGILSVAALPRSLGLVARSSRLTRPPGWAILVSVCRAGPGRPMCGPRWMRCRPVHSSHGRNDRNMSYVNQRKQAHWLLPGPIRFLASIPL
ncbi:hypothetical protein T492DRAFT_159823 [Pavlovales sp. CCMP2436]|nr:hypothetical protein T492DRAFT_159823 [Pavlovales sp. CCMP2436]